MTTIRLSGCSSALKQASASARTEDIEGRPSDVAAPYPRYSTRTVRTDRVLSSSTRFLNVGSDPPGADGPASRTNFEITSRTMEVEQSGGSVRTQGQARPAVKR